MVDQGNEEEKIVQVDEVVEDLKVDDDLEKDSESSEFEESENDNDESDKDVDIVISIDGNEVEHEEKDPAPQWVKELRKKDKEKTKRIKELEAQLESKSKQDVVDDVLPPKPKLSDDGIDYDDELYDSKLLEWNEKRRSIEERKKQALAEQESREAEWKQRLSDYESKSLKMRESLKGKSDDYDDAEDFVRDTFTTIQQSVIVGGADNAAYLVYALGKNKAKAKELAAIKDPVKLAFELGKLEKGISVTTKPKTPKPESKVAGSGSPSKSTNSALERLRAEAEKTGDYTAVMAYKRKLKEQGG